jgi:hypothetical protein
VKRRIALLPRGRQRAAIGGELERRVQSVRRPIRIKLIAHGLNRRRDAL